MKKVDFLNRKVATKNGRFPTRLKCNFSLVIICFIWATVFCSCSRNSGNTNKKSFTWDSITPLEKELFGKKYFIEELKMPSRLLYKNDKLLIIESAPGDSFVHVLDGNSLEYLFPTGAVGYGPGEMPKAWNLEGGTDPNTFWVHSLEGKLFSEYGLENVNDSKALRQVRQKEAFYLAMGITWASDSTFMTFLARGENKFVEFNTDGTRLKGYGKWKGLVPGDFEDHVIADLHQGKLMGDPIAGKFIKASIFRGHLEILDKKSGEIIEINGPENAIPEFEAVDAGAVITSDHPLAYMDAFLGKDHVFGLYSGKTDSEIMAQGRGETNLFVFDLLGNIKTVFKLNTPIKSFTVDEERQRIFGITTDIDPGVVVFDFNL
ncbi:BF3164 family lipoprotein [Cyclobacterium amurskyense]|uniref:BF3164 family lipoprotein n=1 Tax=Cyclobacterium amurskyense TaxID=320787 RepID=UPI0030DBD583|tara:strand:+ start:2160 stop:3287 length:1128 start_codon:yes stop_codon:yes gene_type:complete